MKKLLSGVSLALCALAGAFCLTACTSETKWICPEFSIDISGYSIEAVTNMESDFEFPVEGVKLDHSQFEQNLLEFAWVIYDGNREIVGWIESSGGYVHKKGKYSYGYSADTTSGVYEFSRQSFYIILDGNDLTVFDRFTVSADHGTVTRNENDPPFSATERYTTYDEATNDLVPYPNAENFVCCRYDIDFTGLNPADVDSIQIALHFHS